MVSNQSNLMYLPAGKVIAAGTDIMQAGLQKTWEQDFDERLDYMQYKIDKLTESMSAKQAVAPIDPEQQRNIRQAGILNNASDREILDTMLSYMNGDISIESLPYASAEARINNNKNVKQAGIKKTSDIDIMNTMLEFSGGLH